MASVVTRTVVLAALALGACSEGGTEAGAPGASPPAFDEQVLDTAFRAGERLLFDPSAKRWWAHGPGGDPGASDPAVLVYYSLLRSDGGGVTFSRHDVDVDSGIGTQFPVTDVDGDGKPDIVVSNKKGLFYFHQR